MKEGSVVSGDSTRARPSGCSRAEDGPVRKMQGEEYYVDRILERRIAAELERVPLEVYVNDFLVWSDEEL